VRRADGDAISRITVLAFFSLADDTIVDRFARPPFGYLRDRHGWDRRRCESRRALLSRSRVMRSSIFRKFRTAPHPLPHDRLPLQDLRRIRDTLAQHGMKLHDGEEADVKLAEFAGL